MNPAERLPQESLEELLHRLIPPEGSAKENAIPSGDNIDHCPPEAVWRTIAMGDCAESDAPPLIEHAASCRRCGAILNFWMGILSEDATPWEAAAVSRLPAMTPAWQEQMTARLVAASSQVQAGHAYRRFVWPSIIGIAGALAASALVFLFMHGGHSEQPPERLLAEAYSDHRIMDTRIPLAAFAPVDAARRTRAASSAPLTDSVPLLEARAAITQALMKAPEDPHWLLLEARSDLLNGNCDPAIETLKRLLAGDPQNVAALSDLASAYLMRAKATGVPSDTTAALDSLAQAARLAPQNPVILYNEAVVLGDLYQYSTAVDVWKKFLAVERDREWLADGQRRLAAIQATEAQARQRQSRLDPFLDNSEGMLHLARSPDLVAQDDELLSTVELPRILKTAFPILPPSEIQAKSSSSGHPGPCAGVAPCSDPDVFAARALLHTIASSLAQRHHDPWLADLLATPPTPAFAAAVNALATGIERGHHAHFPDGLEQSELAERLFEEQHVEAGATRAAIEEVFNLQHFDNDRRCFTVARGLPAVFAAHRYPWMEAQFWSDESACHSQQNDFAAAQASLDRALRISEEADYPIIHLRAFQFRSSLEESIGNRDRAVRMDIEGLRTYWQGTYPPIRGAEIYNDLDYIEETSNHPYASVLIHRESVAGLAPLDYPLLLNSNRFLLVKAEIRAGEMQEAAQDLDIARKELAALPDRDVVREANADIGIMLAEAYLTRNDQSAARQQLQSTEPVIAGTGNRDMALRYAAAVGHLALLAGDTAQADGQLTQAVAFAERGYRDIRYVQERIDWIEQARAVYAELALLRLHEGRPPLQSLAIWERYRILSSGVPLGQWCHGDGLDCLAQPLESARARLSQETVLGAIRLDRSLLLWTMDNRGLGMHEVAIDPDRFDLVCHTFSDVVATPDSSESTIRFYGRRIASALLAPVAGTLDPQRTLIFDLDDSMEFLATDALPYQGGYLGLEFATSSVHSILLAERQPSPLRASQKSVVVGASVSGDRDVPPLPEAREEALAVAGYLARPKVFTGAGATADSVAPAVPHAALIHFAGHTRFVDGATRLLLAGGGPAGDGSNSRADWLDARTFRSHDLADCRLVVLSACSTGKREDYDSGDIEDIVETLTAQGVQQVVATHWDVDSAASGSLMKDFYAGLAQGLTVPHAMLQAVRAVSATAEYRHPYFWAPYYVIGISRSNLKELLHHE